MRSVPDFAPVRRCQRKQIRAFEDCAQPVFFRSEIAGTFPTLQIVGAEEPHSVARRERSPTCPAPIFEQLGIPEIVNTGFGMTGLLPYLMKSTPSGAAAMDCCSHSPWFVFIATSEPSPNPARSPTHPSEYDPSKWRAASASAPTQYRLDDVAR